MSVPHDSTVTSVHTHTLLTQQEVEVPVVQAAAAFTQSAVFALCAEWTLKF